MKISYKTSQISNPAMHKMLGWVANCKEYIDDDGSVIKDFEELARLLEFWRKQYKTPEADAITVTLFRDCYILVADGARGEYITVEKKEPRHA